MTDFRSPFQLQLQEICTYAYFYIPKTSSPFFFSLKHRDFLEKECQYDHLSHFLENTRNAAYRLWFILYWFCKKMDYIILHIFILRVLFLFFLFTFFKHSAQKYVDNFCFSQWTFHSSPKILGLLQNARVCNADWNCFGWDL